MTMAAKGIAKLIEECGELQQVLGKKLAHWDSDDHWDGSNLQTRLIEEMGDVMASIDFVVDRLGINPKWVGKRRGEKRALFDAWEADPDNNQHGIDGAGSPTTDEGQVTP